MTGIDQPARRLFEAMGGGCEVVAQAPLSQVMPEDARSAQASHPALSARPHMDPTGDRIQAAVDATIAEVRRIEAKYSRYRNDSVVSMINAAAGGAPVPLDRETGQLLDFADALFHSSAGRFDITSGVLRRAWRFDQHRLPDQGQLDELRLLVGWHRVERSPDAIRLPQPGMEIDFGGFGKEYAADRAAVILQSHGVKHGYVNLGGDFRVVGPKPDGAAWSIGIRHPRRHDRLLAVIPMHRGGLATSGDYERYIEVDGRRYCHILRPDTGWPVCFWQSVTVVAPLAVTAGSLTTQAMLLEGEGLALLRGSGMIFLAVDHTGSVSTHDPHQGL